MHKAPSWAVEPEQTGRVFLLIRSDEQRDRQQICVDEKAAYFLGRNTQTCDFPVPDKSASRVHACIAFRQEGSSQVPVLQDLGSVHGTFLNEGRLEKNGQTDLRDSDEIIIGQASTTFKLLITPLVENSHPEPPTSVLPPQSQAKASDKNLGHAPEPAQASNADAMQANDLQPGSEERLGRSKHKRRHRHHRSRSSPDPQAPLADGVPDSSGQLAENRGQAVDVAGGTSIELGNEERHKRHRGFSESDGSDMDMSPRSGNAAGAGPGPSSRPGGQREAGGRRRKHSPIRCPTPRAGSKEANKAVGSDRRQGAPAIDDSAPFDDMGRHEPHAPGISEHAGGRERQGARDFRHQGRRHRPHEEGSEARGSRHGATHDRDYIDNDHPGEIRHREGGRGPQRNGGGLSNPRRGQHQPEWNGHPDDAFLEDPERGPSRGRPQGPHRHSGNRDAEFHGPRPRHERSQPRQGNRPADGRGQEWQGQHPGDRRHPTDDWHGGRIGPQHVNSMGTQRGRGEPRGRDPPSDHRHHPADHRSGGPHMREDHRGHSSRSPSQGPHRGPRRDFRDPRDRDVRESRDRYGSRQDARRDEGRRGDAAEKEDDLSRKDGTSGPASTDPAELVRQMMGAPGGGPTSMLTADAKKKLLWGKKPQQTTAQPGASFGANQWNKAQFDTEHERERFQKLMGVRATAPTVLQEHEAQAAAADAAAAAADPDLDMDNQDRAAFSKAQQQQVLDSIELDFHRGLRRKDGRSVGLGL